jgi:hypothetical protein
LVSAEAQVSDQSYATGEGGWRGLPGSSVGIATDYGLDGPGIESQTMDKMDG